MARAPVDDFIRWIALAFAEALADEKGTHHFLRHPYGLRDIPTVVFLMLFYLDIATFMTPSDFDGS
jgi:hypothetical protein